MPPPTDLPIHTFPTVASFSTYLQTHHLTSSGIYIEHSKKTSPTPSVSYTEALELCLCYGWIDGRRNSLSSTQFLQRYTPRRAKSNWSARNVEIVGRLVEEGRMAAEGLKRVEEARADGRWERAYKGQKDMEVPADLQEALGEVEGAREVFEGLSKAERFSALLKVQNGNEKTRGKRIEGVVHTLGNQATSRPAIKEKKKRRSKKLLVPKELVAKDVKIQTVRKRSADVAADSPSKQSRRAGLRARSGVLEHKQ